MMSRRSGRTRSRALAGSALLVGLLPAGAHAQRIVYAGDPGWSADLRGSAASAAITGAAPRAGNGSLELRTTGALADWAFWIAAAPDPALPAWGRLADLAALRFDWRRAADPAADPTAGAPWLAQTPVLRLYLRERAASGAVVLSELVWERWYSDPAPVATNSWVTEDLLGGPHAGFWRLYQDPAAAPAYALAGGCAPAPLAPGAALRVATVGGWATADGCVGSPDAEVWGIGLGVGSAWPGAYTGYADNVVLRFGGPEGREVSANFELSGAVSPGTVVPEPAPLPTTLLGAATLLGAWRLRRRARARRVA